MIKINFKLAVGLNYRDIFVKPLFWLCVNKLNSLKIAQSLDTFKSFQLGHFLEK